MNCWEPAISLVFDPSDYLDENYYWIHIMGRLRPGVSLAQAQAALGAGVSPMGGEHGRQ